MLLSDSVDSWNPASSDKLSLFDRNLELNHPNENWKTLDEMEIDYSIQIAKIDAAIDFCPP